MKLVHCEICGAVLKTREALERHRLIRHLSTPGYPGIKYKKGEKRIRK